MKIKEFYIKESNIDFIFGNCVYCALGNCFNIHDYDNLKEYLNLFEKNSEEGISDTKCRKLIPILAGLKNKKATYYSNKNKLSINSFLLSNLKGTFLVSLDSKTMNYGHLMYYKNGVIQDNFVNSVYNDYRDKEDLNKENKLIGWWKITNL